MSIEKITEDPANSIFLEAWELKEIARKSLGKIEEYVHASERFHTAAELALELKEAEININSRVQRDVFSKYYKYEENHCLSAYHYERHEIESAREYCAQARTNLESAIGTIKELPEEISDHTRQHLVGFIAKWEPFLHSIRIQEVAMDAREALDNKKFAEALDSYRSMISLEEDSIALSDKNLPPIYSRIARARAFGSMANASSAIALIIIDRVKETSENGCLELPTDVLIELLSHEKDAYLYSLQAFRYNPEWQQYYDIANGHRGNIESVLTANAQAWSDLYLAFKDDTEFLKIMRMTDLDRFKEVARETGSNEIHLHMNQNFNNIDINGSQIGLLNTGSIHDIQSIDINITKLNEDGNKEFASALKILVEAITSNQEISKTARTELLDQANLLSNQAALPTSERKLGLVKPVLTSLSTGITTVGSLAKIWSLCGDTLCGFFGVENPLKD